MQSPQTGRKSGDIYAGPTGSLVDNGAKSSVISFETLYSLGFEPLSEISRINTGENVVQPISDRSTWPLVVPSIQRYSEITGLKINQHRSDGSSDLVNISDRNLRKPFKWMYPNLADRYQRTIRRYNNMKSAILKNYTSDGSLYVGRIALDADSGRINDKSVAFEVVEDDKAIRLNLDLSLMKNFGLFPGQFIGIRGPITNGTIVVKEIIPGSPLPKPVMPLKNARALHRARAGAGPTRVWVASGPFTKSTNLDYEPLGNFFIHAEASPTVPDLFILQGPFVDAENPILKSGSFELSFFDGTTVPGAYDLAWFSFLEILAEFSSTDRLKNVPIVMIPSTEDLMMDPVFPQWPIPTGSFTTSSKDSVEFFSRITVLPNPSTFVVGDVIFGAVTADIVSHLSMSDVKKGDMDRLTQISRYLMDQRSFYPLYPAGGAAPSTGDVVDAQGALPLEPALMAHVDFSVTPDVLLVSARKFGKACTNGISATGKPYDDVEMVTVNTGPSCRGAADGTFAIITLFPGLNPEIGSQKLEYSVLSGGDESMGQTVEDTFSVINGALRTHVEIRNIAF